MNNFLPVEYINTDWSYDQLVNYLLDNGYIGVVNFTGFITVYYELCDIETVFDCLIEMAKIKKNFSMTYPFNFEYVELD
jgi:hypothetical protein